MVQNECERYWDDVALEATDSGKAQRLEKWRSAARNWLADYADRRAEDFVVDVVGRFVTPKNPFEVLDVGCGPGKWAMLYAKEGAHVTAVDISPHMIELAKQNARREEIGGAVAFHVMPVSKLDIPTGTFDLVNCVTVLQHVLDEEEWRKAVCEMSRVTKKGGYILLFETAPNFAVKKHTAHMRIRTMRRHTDEFKKAGASLVYWRAVDLSLPITILGLRHYAASFNKKVHYFLSKRRLPLPAVLSLLSWAAALVAKQIDYRLGKTPLSFLATGRILLFRKVRA